MDMVTLNKCLKLLYSNDPDSTEQMKIMLEDTIKTRYGIRVQINLSGLGLNNSSDSSSFNEDDSPVPAKKSKYMIQSSPVYPDIDNADESDTTDSDGSMSLEILENDLTCCVCRGLAIGTRNRLVECLECHALYHQECHSPPIADDVNDPRLVWYCTSCTKVMNKTHGSSGKGSPASSGSSSSNSGSSSKSSSKSSSSSSRTSNFSSFSSSNKSFGGSPVAGKSVNSINKEFTANSTSKNNNSVVAPKINIISTDKRLQILKRKAVKKQEKRKLNK